MKKIIYFTFIFTAITKISFSQTLYPWCNYDKYISAFKQNYLGFNDSITKMDLSSQVYKTSNTDPNHTIWIPVVFHVVYSSNFPIQNISDAQIQSQLAILNARFANANAHANGVDTKIQFCFAKTDPLNQTTTGITRSQVAQQQFYIGPNTFGDQRPVLTAIDKWPSDKYLNIWVANILQEVNNTMIDLSGQSSIPITSYSLPDDGIILNYKYVGNVGTANLPGFDKGTTLVHEVGHWLGLFHTFHPEPDSLTACANIACESSGDRVCDTEPVTGIAVNDPYNATDPTKRYDCNTNIVSAENYMDYNFNQYSNFFTSDQKDRMRFHLSYARNYFYQNSLNNPNALAIECSAPSGSPSNPVIPITNGCPNEKYPDEWMMLNGDTSSYVELCEFTTPVIRVSNGTICNKFPLWKINTDCTQSTTNFQGSCGNGNLGCTNICQLFQSCFCFEQKRKVWFSVRASCDDNFNCPDEIGRWKLLDQNFPQTFNVGQQVFDFNFFSPAQLAGNRKYIIKLATFDDQGNWREGQKFLTFIKANYVVPVIINNVVNTTVAPKNIKATNSITFALGTQIPNNSIYEAGQEIVIKDEAGTSGNLIESQFKISPVSCINIAGRVRNDDSLMVNNNPSKSNSPLLIQDEDIKTIFNNQTSKNKIENSFEIDVFPNPSTTGLFHYKILNYESKLDKFEIKIYNSQLQFLKVETLNSDEIDLKNYTDGIYFVGFNTNNVVTFVKIIKLNK